MPALEKCDYGLLAGSRRKPSFSPRTPPGDSRLWAEGPLTCAWIKAEANPAETPVNQSAEKGARRLDSTRSAKKARARKIARAIVRVTAHSEHTTPGWCGGAGRARTGPIHPATRTFMALRILVNREQEELDSLLELAPRLIRSGGRLVIISFMSSEDRKVKEKFRSLAKEGVAQIP